MKSSVLELGCGGGLEKEKTKNRQLQVYPRGLTFQVSRNTPTSLFLKHLY